MKRRHVLVTGASSGIGKEIARQLVQRGDIPLLVARNTSALEALHRELKAGGVFPCDVTDEQRVHDTVEAVIARYGRIDVLINNAGYGRFGDPLDISLTDYEGMANTNYMGTVRLTKAVLPHMLRQGGGRIINIASVAGLTGIPNLSAYCASKFALVGFSEALKLAYAPHIQVGILCPGPVETPFFQGEDPGRLFPRLIAGQLLDTETVAKHTLQLVERPRLKVIPWGLSWAMRMRGVAPGVYGWVTKKLYDSLKKKERKEIPRDRRLQS